MERTYRIVDFIEKRASFPPQILILDPYKSVYKFFLLIYIENLSSKFLSFFFESRKNNNDIFSLFKHNGEFFG